jgi:hypothetical protein
MALTETARRQRGKIAAFTRSRASDDPEFVAIRQAFKAETLTAHVREAVSTAPPLTREQIDRIAAILHGGQPDPIGAAG